MTVPVFISENPDVEQAKKNVLRQFTADGPYGLLAAMSAAELSAPEGTVAHRLAGRLKMAACEHLHTPERSENWRMCLQRNLDALPVGNA